MRYFIRLGCVIVFCFSAQAQDTSVYIPSQYLYKWITDLKNIILVSPKKHSETDTFNVAFNMERHLSMEGRTITEIGIIQLKPFGTDVDGSLRSDTSFLERAGNALHRNTREFIIRNALFFHEGDILDAVKIADSERYLRSLHYIRDVRIDAVPSGENEVKVTVVIQDIFPYSVNFGTNFSSRGQFALSNKNIFGFGLDVAAGVFMDAQQKHLMGYETDISIHNLGHSHISLKSNYLDRYEHRKAGVSLNRDFYTPSIRYAGNITYYNEQTSVRYFATDSSGGDNPVVRFRYFDSWLGRSFLINRRTHSMSSNITLAMRMQHTKFLKRPENAETYYRFQNRTVYLASLSFSRQTHYTTSLVYNYGRTEDIPYGFLFMLAGGQEYNELYNRPYASASASTGYFVPFLGYFSHAATYGTFFRNGATEQEALDVYTDYISNLMVTGRFKQRIFISTRYSAQLNNRLNDHLNISGDMGIPGFRNDSVYGRHRLNLSLEFDLFSPWDIKGFRMVWYAFSNFCWLNDYENFFRQNTLYSSFGFGIRIRNERLVIKTLQLQVAFFPNIPKHSNFRYIHLSKENVLTPRHFTAKAPEIVSLY
ncbi:MAG: hypothetical protein LBS09_09460 [Bacteroidales bacterium]|jgi:outer membrane protein assembly factor BamA|nr:hypothetical protein [Bacteroidales bacterium]